MACAVRVFLRLHLSPLVLIIIRVPAATEHCYHSPVDRAYLPDDDMLLNDLVGLWTRIADDGGTFAETTRHRAMTISIHSNNG